ncbi:hypothetical protein WT60_21695 [Burkholderia sp. MSMB617WGS]|uniref:Uncharacterized protein n=1 Tax=Burkholderia savannae TaxID=1637837 RepID=A0ABR5T4Q3_9BURK|nr:hypothetical protein WS78_19880 [Burkholderia savannae]AOK49533.1 hypothetical protein WT60_21695 [Burkholderia sp. MSMB617WGS]KVG48793.1 hypothetical protein WS77_03465 [Burkholderia sp. MSMB0265]KVG86253.1 hypothetical protein WS81_30135 [Burkholderia sp. MSMB2040]KVG90531.1 hypothetical protein WS82_17600 [Burkholderia sp. MSMB2041]KVH00186.1 hypothetical protein WS83_23370 [Burkholderia sp. MSMB2042]KVK82183.1 hypothetical protein WS91_09405 [Burkholderia sp. MSMB1498]
MTARRRAGAGLGSDGDCAGRRRAGVARSDAGAPRRVTRRGDADRGGDGVAGGVEGSVAGGGRPTGLAARSAAAENAGPRRAEVGGRGRGDVAKRGRIAWPSARASCRAEPNASQARAR